MTDSQKLFFRYCCKDSAVTYEINEKLTPYLTAAQAQHYAFNIETLNPLLYMELRGIRYNHELAKERLCSMQDQVYTFQERLDTQARDLGALKGIDWDAPILPQVQEICCYKKDKEKPKAAFAEAYYEIRELLAGELPLTLAQKGRISVVCKLTMNTKSTKFKDFLYGTCKLPTQYKLDPATKELKRTTDYESLLKLTKTYDHPVLRNSLELSRLRSRAQLLAILPANGRMHASYILVGSETGRVTCKKSVIYVTAKKRAGTNMMAVPDDWDLEDEEHPLTQGMRDLFVADEGCYLGKFDLKAGDGWTVSSYMAMLGDPTMLDDLRFGLKPAQIVAYILKHGATQIQKYAKDRQALKDLVSSIDKDDWEYFVSKQGIWGTCYTMGPRKLAERVFIESDGKVNLSERQAKDFQSAIFVRYRVKLWQNWMQRHLDNQNYPARLVASNGFTRRFYGRKSEILGEALAHLPQVYTTYATLLAANRLFNDPENKLSTTFGSRLRVEPMHFVHDELLVQWKIEDTQWAIDRVKQWFNNPIQIANQTVVIPFDGSYGTAWSMDENHKIGDI